MAREEEAIAVAVVPVTTEAAVAVTTGAVVADAEAEVTAATAVSADSWDEVSPPRTIGAVACWDAWRRRPLYDVPPPLNRNPNRTPVPRRQREPRGG